MLHDILIFVFKPMRTWPADWPKREGRDWEDRLDKMLDEEKPWALFREGVKLIAIMLPIVTLIIYLAMQAALKIAMELPL